MAGESKKPRTTQADIAYWMGQVDGKLESIASQISGIVGRLEKIETWQQKHVEGDKKDPPTTPIHHPKDEDEEETHITFSWVFEKTLVPLILAFLYWFLFTQLPAIVKAIP